MSEPDEDFFGDAADEHEQPDPSITREMFLEWRSPRVGHSNPERMDNPVWHWLVRAKINAYLANEHFDGPTPMEAGPGWSFDRFGQSSTVLSDGRTVLIAGEHEDYYDPDFHIYNDVVIRHPDGRIEIFGYPEEAFPPTDFHSSTLVGDRIILIGNLGYPDQRKANETQVLALDLQTWAISQVPTFGTPPGWLHGHSATLSEDHSSIVIKGGKLHREGQSLLENIDDWQLRLTDWRWERLTDRKWQRWELSRQDGESNNLWQLHQMQWLRDAGLEEEFQKQIAPLAETFGVHPNLDAVATLYRPEIPHEQMPDDEDDHTVHRINVEGVVVRYVEDMYSIQITVEGDLPQETIDALTADLRKKLSAIENTPYELKRL